MGYCTQHCFKTILQKLVSGRRKAILVWNAFDISLVVFHDSVLSQALQESVTTNFKTYFCPLLLWNGDNIDNSITKNNDLIFAKYKTNDIFQFISGDLEIWLWVLKRFFKDHHGVFLKVTIPYFYDQMNNGMLSTNTEC